MYSMSQIFAEARKYKTVPGYLPYNAVLPMESFSLPPYTIAYAQALCDRSGQNAIIMAFTLLDTEFLDDSLSFPDPPAFHPTRS